MTRADHDTSDYILAHPDGTIETWSTLADNPVALIEARGDQVILWGAFDDPFELDAENSPIPPLDPDVAKTTAAEWAITLGSLPEEEQAAYEADGQVARISRALWDSRGVFDLETLPPEAHVWAVRTTDLTRRLWNED